MPERGPVPTERGILEATSPGRKCGFWPLTSPWSEADRIHRVYCCRFNFASVITLPHLSCSARRNASNTAGVLPTGSIICSEKVLPRLGSFMPQVEADNWYGLVAPAATPQPILAKLQAAAAEALRSAEVKDKLAAQSVIAVGSSSAEFSAYVKSETERWGKVIASSGIKIK